jgi:hypothetical protein
MGDNNNNNNNNSLDEINNSSIASYDSKVLQRHCAYEGVISLNNVGATLVNPGAYVLAVTTFKGALATLMEIVEDPSPHSENTSSSSSDGVRDSSQDGIEHKLNQSIQELIKTWPRQLLTFPRTSSLEESESDSRLRSNLQSSPVDPGLFSSSSASTLYSFEVSLHYLDHDTIQMLLNEEEEESKRRPL